MKRVFFLLVGIMGLSLSLEAFELSIPIDGQLKRKLGVSGFLLFNEDEEVLASSARDGIIIPLLDMGIFGQLNLGRHLHFGLGMQWYSLFVANAIWPAAYAEINIWRLSINAQVGGGFFAGHVLWHTFFVLGKYFVPEASLWFRLSNITQLGVGALTLYSPDMERTMLDEGFVKSAFNNHTLIFIGVKWGKR
jgi:hypothetical protein